MTQRRSAIALWLVSLVAIALSAAFVLARVARPADGTLIPFYLPAWQPDGVIVEVRDPVALRPGDLVTTVAGVPLERWLEGSLDPTLDRSALGASPVAYGIKRAGEPATVSVSPRGGDSGSALRDYWSAIVFTIVFQLVAWYLLLRRPGEPASAALTIAAVGISGSTLPWLLGLQVADVTAGWPFVLHAATAGGLYMLLWPAGAIHLPLALSGRVPLARRLLALAYGLPLGAYVAGLVATRLTSPTITAWVGTWAPVQLLVIIPTVVAGMALSVIGYRRADDDSRRRVRWVLAGGVAATLPSVLLILGPELVTGHPIVPWSAVGLLALPLPIGVAAAVVRGRLFDIEIAVNRTLVYGGATVSVVAIYAATVLVLGSSLGSQASFPSQLLAIGLAALVALPIRDRLQQVVNRLLYGDRDDPYRALARLGRRLEGAIDPVEAPQVIVGGIAESLRIPWAAISLTLPGDERATRVFAHGSRPDGDVVQVPLVYGAESIGMLSVAPRSPAQPLSARDRQLLEALARQAGPAVHNVRLTLDLIASRERLVAAREEERRRIRRDLHDGLGPTLAAIGMRAEVAAELARDDATGAEQVLRELRAEVHDAIGDVRRLVDALRPPALDELGLIGAIAGQAARLGPPPAVDVVSGEPLPELPAAIEVAAYRIAVEAMTNAARHAKATACQVRLEEVPGPAGEGHALQVEVTDDGTGLATGARPGIGLASMRARAAEVGGVLSIDSPPGGGTRVRATLPLAAPGGAA